MTSLVNANLQDSISLTLKYDNGKLTTHKLYAAPIYAAKYKQTTGDYFLEIINSKGIVLQKAYFDINLNVEGTADPAWFDENGEQIYIPSKPNELGQRRLLTEYKTLVIPFYPLAKEIIVYKKPRQRLLSIKIAHLQEARDAVKKTNTANAPKIRSSLPNIPRELNNTIPAPSNPLKAAGEKISGFITLVLNRR